MSKEPLQGLRRHKLMTAAMRASLPAFGRNKDQIAYVKFFSPFGRYTLYVTEFDGEDLLYGWCVSWNSSSDDEWGYSSLRELAEATAFGGVPAIERDLYFKPDAVSKLLAKGA